jgi:broad specificity phosphatase PhoE
MPPATILLMRHAEKPEDRRGPHLSQAGRRRAERLAAYIPEVFGPPDFLFAAADKPGSHRPRLTLQPLAAATGLAVTQFPDRESDAFASKLLAEPKFAEKRVVVSWRHDALPALARALGAPEGFCPDPWPEGLYDLLLQFDYEADRKARVSALTQPF